MTKGENNIRQMRRVCSLLQIDGRHVSPCGTCMKENDHPADLQARLRGTESKL